MKPALLSGMLRHTAKLAAVALGMWLLIAGAWTSVRLLSQSFNKRGEKNLLEVVDSEPAPRHLTKRPPGESITERYLEVLKLYLTRYDFGGDTVARETGLDWPRSAETMIGLKRLDNLHECIKAVIRDKVPGDLLEAGVWRGGATIFMRAALLAYKEPDRRVWAADSFEGLPAADAGKYPADGGRSWTKANAILAVSLEDVKANFARYGLLDDQVRFLKGWFRDTLANAPIRQLAVLRLDGDMYESTMEALISLYPRLSVGGYAIVDDYGNIPGCRHAVKDYRQTHGVTEEIVPIDWGGVFWRKIEQPPSIVNAPGSGAMEKQTQTSAIAPRALHTGAEAPLSGLPPLITTAHNHTQL